ncbi:TetR/AcrR family transcriptional regulator [Spirosoma utsteinense]|uniref:TetR/AcrR family transcriptional regulator n=1 Tax=Spirosoma utsteinense TaxID=2585773 RepID=UPI0016488793|nr:TetR/AcrR family transcriptional regulator [Spirosoma utsteinense]MBC3789104.1 AcrR family transcriptional regulator [Spirosoma utsteinense]
MKGTKEKLIDAAVVALNRDESATIEQIANVAGVTRRTVHRYFNDRNTLVQECKQTMLQVCNLKMTEAYHSSEQPALQLENMFYAALEVGVQYSFVKKLFKRNQYTDLVNNYELAYEDVKANWFKLVKLLQQQGAIDRKLSIPWIYNLFGGMVDIAIEAQQAGDVARNDIKNFSWTSFKGSIGLQ